MASFEQAGQGLAQGLKPDSPTGVTLNLQLAVSLPDTGAMALREAYRLQMPHEKATAPTSAQVNSISVDKPLRGVLCAPKKLNEYASTDSLSYPFRRINAASILSIPYGPVERAHPQWFVWSATDSGPAGENGKRAGGEIFDLLKGYSPDSLANTLDRLDVFLKRAIKL